MAKLYILTDEQIKSGKRPKTPREKQRNWRVMCLVLSAAIIIEHISLFFWFR
jgi:hypothetical protein